MRKILILGGKPIGSIELVEQCKQRGLFTIVTDYLPQSESPAKQYADECWSISTADVDTLERKCRDAHVNAVLTAVHEFNINRMLDLCERLELPCYCKRSTWLYCDSKVAFKNLCQSNNLPIAKRYEISGLTDSELDKIDYPVVAKPVDGSGSRGFSICANAEELQTGYKNAKKFSPTGSVLVEDYIPFDAVIIHYTMIQGKCYFSGISDKYSVKFPSTGASVMGLQLFPSKGIKKYLELVDAKARNMFETAGFTNGPIWIEAFYDGHEKFVFNEMGYRLGGSLTNYPVKYFYKVNQLDQMISVALGETLHMKPSEQFRPKNYCILPVHIHAGRIAIVNGQEELKKMEDLYAYVLVHFEGDEIQEWGSAQQVFCYLHILYKSNNDLSARIHEILSTLKALNENGDNMLYTLYDIDSLEY